MKYPLSLITLAIIFAFCFCSCQNKTAYRYEEGVAWNTAYHIIYESENELTDSIISIFNDIDSSLSPFNGESTVTKINENRSKAVDTNVKKVYEESRKINKATDGAFDPTLAPLIRAWGFGQGHKVSGDTLKLDSLLRIVGINKTKIAGDSLIKEDPRIEFNFSALAKGYGVDCIAEMLERNGVLNYLVEVGGEIRTSGVNQKGTQWSVGIDRPETDSKYGDIVETIYIGGKSLATSGNYRNYHKSGDSKFGHTISPKDGRPIESDIISATVIAPTCMEADALATSCMVIGSEAALDLCQRLRAGVMLIKSDMTIVANEEFNSYLKPH